MEAKLAYVDSLLSLERRVCRVYQGWAANGNLSAGLRSFFKVMAEEEKQHLAILEHSASLLNFAAARRRGADRGDRSAYFHGRARQGQA